jgi:RNA polymerase sigma factor (sigma-70 family)
MNVIVASIGAENLHSKPDTLPDTAPHTTIAAQSKRQLLEFLTHNTGPLLGTLRSYVQRMGLAQGEAVPVTALEVLQETVIEALDHAARFDPSRQPMAWLLGIAMNVIKRKKVERAKHYQHEISISQLSRPQGEPLSESEYFELIAPFAFAGPEQDVEANEQAAGILALVSAEDRHILRLAYICEFEREDLAQQLGITSGAARVRLHRALTRLRTAWNEQQQLKQSPLGVVRRYEQ